jgi:hypothetical protein
MEKFQLVRITARVPYSVRTRLETECARRHARFAQPTTFGAVLTDLIMLHLPKVPGESSFPAEGKADQPPRAIRPRPETRRKTNHAVPATA